MPSKKKLHKQKPKAILLNSLTRDSTAILAFLNQLDEDQELTLLAPIYLQDATFPADLVKNMKYLVKKVDKESGEDYSHINFTIDAKKSERFNSYNESSLEFFNNTIKSRRTLFLETIDYLEEALEEFDILLTVVTNEALVHERIFIMFSKAHKIPTLHINHGLHLWQTSSAYRTGNCDYYLAASQLDEKILLHGAEKLNPNYKSFVPGMLSVDKYYLLKANKKAIFPKNLPKDKKIVTFFTTFDNTVYVRYLEKDSYEKSLETAMAIAEKLHTDPDTFFVLKDRPTNYGFAKEKFEILINKYKIDKNRIIYVFDYPEPYIVASDLIVVVSSTVAVEAMICEKPVVNINFAHTPEFPIETHVPSFNSDDDIGGFILELFADENKMKMLQNLQKSELVIGDMKDGLSSLRGAKYISQILGFKTTEKKLDKQFKEIKKWQAENPNPSIEDILNDKNPNLKYWKTINSLIKYDQRFLVTDAYEKWKAKQQSNALDGELMAQRMVSFWHSLPVFHLIYIVDASLFDQLSQSLAALEHQLYKNFIISVISTDEIPTPELLELENFNWIKSDAPFAEVNNLVEQVNADWIILPIAGDEFNYDALFYFAEYANFFSDWLAIYSDEDNKSKETEKNKQKDLDSQKLTNSKDLSKNSAIDDYYKSLKAKMPIFKPDFNLELYRSTDYIGATVALKKDLIQAFGGFLNLAYTQASQILFVLAEQMTSPAIGHIPRVLNHRGSFNNHLSFENKSIDEFRIFLRQEHLKRCGFKEDEISLIQGLKPSTYKSIFKPKEEKRVAILIDLYASAKNSFARLLSSLKDQDYKNLEIFLNVPANFTAENTKVLENVLSLVKEKFIVHILHNELKNKRQTLETLMLAAKDFENLIFLQSDTEVLQDNFIEEMLNHSIKPEVAMIGARIINTNGQVLSAGQVLGFNGDLDDVYKNFHLEQDLELLPRLWCDQNYSALSPLAIFVKRSAFEEVGGFDESFSDYFIFADLGIRMQIAGRRLHWSPYATCVSYQENANYANFRTKERDLWFSKWSQLLLNDPSHNMNLALTGSGNEISTASNSWGQFVFQLPRVASYPLYLKQSQLDALNSLNGLFSILHLKEKIIQNHLSLELEILESQKVNPLEILRTNPDIIFITGIPFYNSMKKDIYLIKKYYGKKLIGVLETKDDLQDWQENINDIDLWIILGERASFDSLPPEANCFEINLDSLEEFSTTLEEQIKNELVENIAQDLLEQIQKILGLENSNSQ